MVEYKLRNGILTQEDVDKLNKTQGYEIILKNTKGQNADLFAKLQSHTVVRIIGGFDDENKPKYKAQKYYERTIYTPLQVSQIIKQFEKLESGIDKNWTAFEKALYVYSKFIDTIRYDEHDGVSSRNLRAIVNGCGVCVGYASLYKEAMDRLGIECEFINMPDTHSWNSIKIDGNWYPVDLTWDADRKQNYNKTELKYFGLDPNFSKNPYHQACSQEPKLQDNCFDRQKLSQAEQKIFGKTNQTTWTIIRDDGTKCALSQIGKAANGINVFAYTEIMPNGTFGFPSFLYSEVDMITLQKTATPEEKSFIRNVLFSETNINNNKLSKLGYIGSYEKRNGKFMLTSDPKQSNASERDSESFIRDNGSTFTITKSDRQVYEGVFHYKYIDFIFDHNGRPQARHFSIYSENQLVGIKSIKEKNAVANLLLTQSRLHEKIDKVGGYVGYLKNEGAFFQKYYDPKKEQEIGNFIR